MNIEFPDSLRDSETHALERGRAIPDSGFDAVSLLNGKTASKVRVSSPGTKPHAAPPEPCTRRNSGLTLTSMVHLARAGRREFG